jgi:hypothetical protein
LGLLDLLRQRDDALGHPADLAIVGTAKNVGKTTTLNWLLERLERLNRSRDGDGDESSTLGLTSVGRDGEDLDAVTDLPKPRIVPPLGTLVATSETSAARSASRLSLVSTTPFRTALGQIGIYRVATAGPVEVSGPVTVADAAEVRARLHGFGAKRVLVDGAIDRMASASNRVADAVVLATGLAVLDAGGGRLAGPRETPGHVVTQFPAPPATAEERIADVVRRTAFVVMRLQTPAAGIPVDLELRTGALLPGGRFEAWEGGSPLDHARQLITWLPCDAEALVLSGALTDGVVNAIMHDSKRGYFILVPDGTHVLCSDTGISRLSAAGIRVRAVQSIPLLAMTANPTAPHVASVDSRELLDTLRTAFPFPVFDLVATPSPL